MTANVKRCALVVLNEDKKEDKANPVNFKLKRGEYDVPMVDQCTYLGVDISNDSSWDAHKARVIGKDKPQVT